MLCSCMHSVLCPKVFVYQFCDQNYSINKIYLCCNSMSVFTFARHTRIFLCHLCLLVYRIFLHYVPLCRRLTSWSVIRTVKFKLFNPSWPRIESWIIPSEKRCPYSRIQLSSNYGYCYQNGSRILLFTH